MKNDWIITNINNPDFTVGDLKNIGGLTLENTELLPIDKYLKSDKILQNPIFLNELGLFSLDKFKDYYNKLASKFQNFLEESSLDNYEYGFWDVFQKPTSRIRNPLFTIDKVSNPTHQSYGIVGINTLGERTKSDFELAETQKIFDWNTGKFIDETPEDSVLFSNPLKFITNLFKEPLVLAKYDEDSDEIDPLTGQLVHHKKGENKTNSEGNYYFETLGGRSLVGKNILSVGDLLTKEDSAVNKYDFFDSDDLEKSIEGVIAKNLVAIAPMIFLGPVGSSIYAGFYVGREMLKTLPMLERIGTILSSEDGEENSMLNTLAAYGQKFTGNTSDYGKQNTFSFENFGNLISDVALLWGLQKFIADSLRKLSTSNKNMMLIAEAKALSLYEKQANNIINNSYRGELSLAQAKELAGIQSLDDITKNISSGAWKNTVIGNKTIEQSLTEVRDIYAKKLKLGQDLSLVYMSLISNTDVYDSAIEHGATKLEAAAVALGSIVGMFGVDKYLGLGEMFFDDENAILRRLYRKLLKDHYDSDVAPVISSLAIKPEAETTKGLLNFFKTGKEKTIDFLKNYQSDIKDRALGIIGKSIGEGLEEVSEELVTDINKSLYEIAGKFGYVSQTDIGAWDKARDRYLMSFFGGAIGGGIFGGIEAIKNPKSASDINSRDTLLTIIRQEGSLNILKELDKMKDEGKLGSKELSINTQNITGEDGSQQKVFIPADKDNISQNEFNYNQMKSAILLMDKIINGNQLNISDDKLFERMITSDLRLASLKDYLKDASYMSGYYQDFQKLVGDIYQNELEIANLQNESDPTKRTATYEEDLLKLLSKREELNLRKEDFFNNKTQYYLEKTMFAINPSISGFFLPITFEDYVLKEYGKPLRFLSDNDKKEAKEKYDTWVKTKKVLDLDNAFNSFKEMSKKILPVLQELSISDVEGWKTLREEINKNLPDFDDNIFYDTRIESKNINVELTLKDLKIIRGEEYDKPWRSDPTKSNKAFQLLLEENPSLYFEIVKDHEDGFWSIHFKTDNGKDTHTDLTEELKLRLFEAAAAVIPEGDKLSTWGSLTRGGISGLNRFGRFRGFRKFGERKVSLKAGLKQVQIKFDESLIPNLEKLKSEKSVEVLLPILRSKNGASRNLLVRYSIDDNENINIEIPHNKDSFLIAKSLIPSDSQLREESSNPDFDFNNLEDYGYISSISRRNGEWFTEVVFNPKGDTEGDVTETFKGLLAPELVPEELRGNIESSLTLGTTYNAEEELTIPIWQKLTGESDEEYENRNTQLEGETDELFEARKNERKKLLIELHTDFLIQSILNLINNNTSIDSNTFRYIMSNLGYRVKDIKKAWTNYIGLRNSQIHSRIQDSLAILNNDLSNIDDVWNQINSKIIEYTNELFSLAYEGLSRISSYDGLKSHERGLITFLDILNFIDEQTNDLIDLGDYNDDFNKTDAHILVVDDLGESRESLAAVDTVNINRALDSNGTITLNNGYEITYTNGSGETININVDPGETLDAFNTENQLILSAIRENIAEEYQPQTIVGYSEEEFNKYLLTNQNAVKLDFDNIIGQLSRDPRYKTLVELLKKLQTKDNPTLKLLNAIASKLGENFGSIEETLQTIYEQFDGLTEASDFVLNDSLIEALEKAKMLLDFAVSTIIASSGEDSYGSPWAYNKTINEWNKEHRSLLDREIEDLPEISLDLANVSLSSILYYLQEIDSWLKKAKSNRVNKVKMFKEFDTHFEQVKLKFFMDNKEKWITEDGINLLDGIVEKENPKDLVLEYERALHKNVLNLLKEGKNFEYIFDAFKDSINWQLAGTLKTSKLDINLNELSDYDKFIYLVSIISQNPDNFYTDYKKFVENNKTTIAPLSFLKQVIRILKAHENNKELFNEFLKLFKKESGLDDLSILENTVISTGIGGSGKTSVGAKSIINKNSWVCGPTDTQINNLKELAPNLKGYSVKDLLKLILEDLYDKQTGIKSELITTSDKKGDGGRADISRLNIKTFDNPPSNIILDEATLVSNAELQVIAKWCKLNNIQLNLIGDENLNGDNTPGNNIARETTIAVRTPKMQLSLRDGNIWKYLNLLTLMNLEDLLRDTNTSEETSAVKNRLINTDLGKFGLKYYFKDGTLTGDMIVDSITDELIQSLNGTIKFIGSESSLIYLKLKSSGKNIEKAYSLKEILGLEADYVVADINWKDLAKFNNNAFKLLDFMRSLYTVITRSKKGSIIINNGLNSIIKGNIPLSYSTDSVIIDKNAIKEFSDVELNWLNNLQLNPDSNGETNIQRGLDDNSIIEPIIPEEEVNNSDDNNKELRSDNDYIPSDISELPILVYTNFNYLGINRNEDGIWYNESDSYRDIGIFLRPGIEVSEDKDKRNYSDLLFDLKSFIIYNDVELYNSNASAQLKQHFSKKNLEDILYFIVRELNNLQTHHLISEEQGLEELPEGEEIFTLQARLKNKEGKDCIITLGVLPKSTNLHEEITSEAIERKIQKLQSTPGNESEINKLLQIIEELNNGSASRSYQDSLDNISNELEIEKPDFTEICGLSKIRGKNSRGETSYFKVRLSEIALSDKGEISNKSRFDARTSNYVISPIYTSVDSNDPNAGKPCIFVSGRRIYNPTELADKYEEQVRDGLPPTIRKIMLDPAGVSFESLFDSRYAKTFTSKGSGNNSYTFPFDLLPVGIRMYTALHNFRANLRKFNKAVKDKFGDDLISLEKRLKEESRLFILFKESNSVDNPNETTFRTWLQNNQRLISSDITFDLILEIWKFNDENLKDVKLFRLGYNERNGVYVRNISDGYLGNYINPQVAKQYLGTVEKIFEIVIDLIIPKNSINPNDLVDYRITLDMYEKLEKNWVNHIENSGLIILNIVDSDEEGNVENIIPITIEHKDKIKALPLVLTMMTKFLQARLRMSDPDALFEGYDNISENSPYLVKLGDTSISYLKILEGGLGDIRNGRDIEPGVIELEDGQSNSDRRLLNMFNIAFHGTVATGGNDFTKSVSEMHAKDVIFPKGIFVDPILGGKVDKTRKYRLVSTNPKYYLTNVAPSGAKTFVKILKKETNSAKLPVTKFKIGDEVDIYTSEGLYQGEGGEWTVFDIIINNRGKTLYRFKNNRGATMNLEVDIVDSNPNKYKPRISPFNKLHLNLNTIIGEEVDITGTVTDNQELVDLANSKINSKLSEHYFSPSGRFSTPEDLLNLTTSLTLNEDGTITENKLKDFEELKNKGKFIEIKKDGNIYTLITDSGKSFDISFIDSIKVHPNIPNVNGTFSWSIKDALETYKEDFEFIDPKNKEVIEKAIQKKTSAYESPEAFLKAFDSFLNQLKSKNSSAYEDLISTIIGTDELINKLLSSC